MTKKPPFKGVIRYERREDIPAIHDITQAAFADRPFSIGTEGAVIKALRRLDHLTVSLVAETEGKVVGHIAISPATVQKETDGIYALGPVAVRPDLRHKRIGTALIEAALTRTRSLNAKCCVLIGDPIYYSRFGFVGNAGLTHGQVPPIAVQILSWDGEERFGKVIYSPAFDTKD